MDKYKLVGNRYQDVNGRDYTRGDIVESSRPLDQTFPHHFEKISDEVETEAPVVEEQEVEEDTTEALPDIEGKEVTDNYPDSVAEIARVFKRGRYCYVYPHGDSEPANETGMLPDDVENYVDSELGE